MRHDVVPSEITGRGYRNPNVPAPIDGQSSHIGEIRNKEGGQGTNYAASCGAIRMVRKQE